MSRLFSTLIAGTFATGSAHALAHGLVDSQKQAELDRIIADGNANATARGEKVVAMAQRDTTPVSLRDRRAHDDVANHRPL